MCYREVLYVSGVHTHTNRQTDRHKSSSGGGGGGGGNVTAKCKKIVNGVLGCTRVERNVGIPVRVIAVVAVVLKLKA